MTRRVCFFVIALAFGLATPAAAQQPGEAAVRSVIERYMHGLKFNDIRDFQAAFRPDAKLMFVKRDGSMGQLTQEDWYKGFANVAGKEEEGEFRIVSVDITDNAASVKVMETYPKSEYVTYLSLLRLGGEWRIVNKIYTSHPR
jgi:deglycase